MANVQVAILAAGMGTRLGRPLPKPLTRLSNGRTILEQQIDNVRMAFGSEARITIVVGFKFELLMEQVPNALFVYNEGFDHTNTAKSLLKALLASHEGSVVWLNGDVVFDPEVLQRLTPFLVSGRSAVAVNSEAVSDEEVKYTVNAHGMIDRLSKSLEQGLGEAIGINLIGARDKPALIRRLEACADQDYFERGLETAIAEDGIHVAPVDVSDLFAVEIDTEDDLARVNHHYPSLGRD